MKNGTGKKGIIEWTGRKWWLMTMTVLLAGVCFASASRTAGASASNSQALDKPEKYFTFSECRGEVAITGMTEAGKKLKDVIIPDYYKGRKVTRIYEYAFDNATAMERATISDNVEFMDYYDGEYESMGGDCFRGCSNLREIHLGKNLMEFGIRDRLPNLEKITVAKENKYFQVRDNVLFSGEDKLVYYPAGRKDTFYDVPDGVSLIRYGAFCWAENLQKVSLPEGIKDIGGAFYHSGLKEVVIPEGVEGFGAAFAYCENLERAELPVIRDSWGSERICGAFKGCRKLKSVIFKNKSNRFAGDNFSGCESLEEFELAPGAQDLTVKDGILFDGEMKTLLIYPAGRKQKSYCLPAGVERIGVSAFEGAQFLSEVKTDQELRQIDDGAFQKSKLGKVQLNQGLERLGYSVFSETDIRECKLPDSVKSLKSGVFDRCSKLKTVRLSKNLTKIDRIFDYCTALSTIHIPGKVKSICVPFTVECSGLTSITVDSKNKYYTSVKGILYDRSKKELIAYPANRKGKKFTLPKSVAKIRAGAFRDNRRLQEIVINDRIKKIESRLFSDCSSLKSVTLGKKVSRIGSYAFYNCKNLRKLTFMNKSWKKKLAVSHCFEGAGKGNYQKLEVRVPKSWYRHRKTLKKEFYRAGLSKKAKIKFISK